MVASEPEEIPELVRVFCLNHEHCPDDCSSDGQHARGFDYRAATELLRRDPQQVRYATYVCTTRRDCFLKNNAPSNRDSKHNCQTLNTHACNPCLHSPLRWACIETTKEAEAMEFLKAIRDIDPTQFLLQDIHGDLPIDGECVLNASLELLSFLLEIYLDYDFQCPNGVGMTEANFNPITCLCGSYWWEDINKAYEDILSGAYIVSGKNVLEDNLGIEDNFWKKIILLTKAFYHKTIDDEEEDVCGTTSQGTTTAQHQGLSSSPSKLRIVNQYGDRNIEFRLLHACAGIDWFPPNLLRLLVAAFPDALLETDEDGNLPIHIASGGIFKSYKIDANWEGDFEANSGYQKTTIDILLEANPDLASIPDAEGRLPLELAIESEDILEAEHKSWRPWEDGGIGSILKAYPKAARIRSPVSGRLPLEITLGRESCRDWEDGVKALLGAYPEAARLKNPRTGKYPLQLAIERETHFDVGVYGLLEVCPEAVWDCVQSSSLRRSSNVKAPRQESERMPLFALAASENCSSSVVYKLLRTHPESCRRCFDKTTRHRHPKRKQRGNEERSRSRTLSFPLSVNPSNKRLKLLSNATTLPQKAAE